MKNTELKTYESPRTETVVLGSEGLVCISGKGDDWSWSFIKGGGW